MPVVPGLPRPSLRFRLRLLGWLANCFIWCFSFVVLVCCILAVVWLLVWSWRLWPSPLYAVPVSVFLAVSLFTISFFVLFFTALMLDAYCSSGSLRVHYAAAHIAHLDAALPASPAAALAWLVPAALPVLHELLLEQGQLLRKDDLSSVYRLRRLALAEHRLACLASRLDSVLASPLAADAAAAFFSAHRVRYAAPSVQYHESFDSFPAHPPTLQAPEAFFVLNGRHLVETRPLPSLDPVQTALRVWLRDARPLVKDPSVRCMIAPGWLHALLTDEHGRFTPPRAPLLPSVSDARLIAHAEATVDIFVGLWCPPAGFERCLAAAEKLARQPFVRATARPAG
jgi:hypothetical protein